MQYATNNGQPIFEEADKDHVYIILYDLRGNPTKVRFPRSQVTRLVIWSLNVDSEWLYRNRWADPDLQAEPDEALKQRNAANGVTAPPSPAASFPDLLTPQAQSGGANTQSQLPDGLQSSIYVHAVSANTIIGSDAQALLGSNTLLHVLSDNVRLPTYPSPNAPQFEKPDSGYWSGEEESKSGSGSGSGSGKGKGKSTRQTRQGNTPECAMNNTSSERGHKTTLKPQSTGSPSRSCLTAHNASSHLQSESLSYDFTADVDAGSYAQCRGAENPERSATQQISKPSSDPGNTSAAADRAAMPPPPRPLNHGQRTQAQTLGQQPQPYPAYRGSDLGYQIGNPQSPRPASYPLSHWIPRLGAYFAARSDFPACESELLDWPPVEDLSSLLATQNGHRTYVGIDALDGDLGDLNPGYPNDFSRWLLASAERSTTGQQFAADATTAIQAVYRTPTPQNNRMIRLPTPAAPSANPPVAAPMASPTINGFAYQQDSGSSYEQAYEAAEAGPDGWLQAGLSRGELDMFDAAYGPTKR